MPPESPNPQTVTPPQPGATPTALVVPRRPLGLPTGLSLPRQVIALSIWPLLEQLMAFLVGFVEFFGSVSVWFHSTPFGALGALAILGTSSGALVFHLSYDTWKDGVPSMVTFALSAFLAWGLRMPLIDFLV